MSTARKSDETPTPAPGRSTWDIDSTPTPFMLSGRKIAVEATTDAAAPRRKRPRNARILLIDANVADARLIRESLLTMSNFPHQFEHADQLTKGLEILACGETDIVLLDLSLSESWGLNTLLRVKAAAPHVPIVVLTGLDDDAIGVTAVQEGAQDYLVKGKASGGLLVRSIRYAIERTRRRQAEDKWRRVRHEFRVAHRIQRKLFPHSAPALEGIEFGGASYPAEDTGGDYFDFIPMLDDRCGIAVGDVAGHGFGPALLMADTRAYLRALARTLTDAGEVLNATNVLLVEDVADDHFVTLFLGCLDARTRSLSYASAGHPDAFVLDRTGTVTARLESTGRPLGIDRANTYAAASIRLVPGSLVVLVTDGVLESRSYADAAFGPDRMLDVIRANRHRPAQQIVESLYAAIREFCNGKQPIDDITALVAKIA